MQNPLIQIGQLHTSNGSKPALLVVMANMGNARLLAKNIDGDVPEEVGTLVELLHDGPELGIHTLLHTQQMRQFSDIGSYGQLTYAIQYLSRARDLGSPTADSHLRGLR